MSRSQQLLYDITIGLRDDHSGFVHHRKYTKTEKYSVQVVLDWKS